MKSWVLTQMALYKVLGLFSGGKDVSIALLTG